MTVERERDSAGAGRADHSGPAACPDADRPRRCASRPPATRRGRRRATDAWLTTVNILIGLWTGLLSFAILGWLLPAALVLTPVFLVGVPLLAFALLVSRWFGDLDRGRYRLVLGVDIPSPHPDEKPDGSVADRFRTLLRTPARWREAGYGLLRFPLSVVEVVLVVAAWLLPLGGLTLPIYNWSLPHGGANLAPVHRAQLVVAHAGLPGQPAAADQRPADGALARQSPTSRSPAGCSGPTRWPPGSASWSAAGPRWSSRPNRSAAGSSATCTTAPSSGWSRWPCSSAGPGPGSRPTRRAPARCSTRPTTRPSSRWPSCATWPAGCTRPCSPTAAWTRRCPGWPPGRRSRCVVEVDPAAGDKPVPVVDAIAYFVVAEALTNVAKHARATRAAVVVRRLDGMLRVVVTDDGVGGADPALGTGLRGLADRVSGVDGRLHVDSPPGGPTVLTVELPCVS